MFDIFAFKRKKNSQNEFDLYIHENMPRVGNSSTFLNKIFSTNDFLYVGHHVKQKNQIHSDISVI